MIQIRGLSKCYPSREAPALHGIDLDIPRARVTAVVGPNGAGKSTLMRILLGLTRADTGTVLIDGAAPIDERGSRERIGYMPQIAHLPARLTPRELFALAAALRGRHAAEADSAADAFGLAALLDRRLGTLSGGTKQRVNAMLAFAFGPDILLLDEPTAGLDPSASALLKDRILSERGEGRTVVVTSHVMSDLEELADDIVLLVDGVIRFAGPVLQLVERTSQRNLERALASLACWTVAA